MFYVGCLRWLFMARDMILGEHALAEPATAAEHGAPTRGKDKRALAAAKEVTIELPCFLRCA